MNRANLIPLRTWLLAAAAVVAASRGVPADTEISGRLYVTSWFGGVVSVVDLRTSTLRATIPVGVQNHNVFLNPSRTHAWVANNNDGTVTILETASNKVVDTVDVGAGPRHTFFSSDGDEAYVTLEFDNAVAVVDAKTHAVLDRIAVGHMPHFPIAIGEKAGLYALNLR